MKPFWALATIYGACKIKNSFWRVMPTKNSVNEIIKFETKEEAEEYKFWNPSCYDLEPKLISELENIYELFLKLGINIECQI